MERESILRSIAERYSGDARSKEMAVVENGWFETGNWEPYKCCPRTSTQNKRSKKCHWSPGYVLSMQALQEESWKCHPCCQFVFYPSWKPIQEETRETWKKKHAGSCAKNLKLNMKTNGSRINQSQCWRMKNIKYFMNLQSRQIRK